MIEESINPCWWQRKGLTVSGWHCKWRLLQAGLETGSPHWWCGGASDTDTLPVFILRPCSKRGTPECSQVSSFYWMERKNLPFVLSVWLPLGKRGRKGPSYFQCPWVMEWLQEHITLQESYALRWQHLLPQDKTFLKKEETRAQKHCIFLSAVTLTKGKLLSMKIQGWVALQVPTCLVWITIGPGSPDGRSPSLCQSLSPPGWVCRSLILIASACRDWSEALQYLSSKLFVFVCLTIKPQFRDAASWSFTD